MKEVEIRSQKILLVNQRGKISAVGGKCTHYGAPLVKGAFSNGTVRCPWHGACFNVSSGDIEDFPGLDSLPVYQVLYGLFLSPIQDMVFTIYRSRGVFRDPPP